MTSPNNHAFHIQSDQSGDSTAHIPVEDGDFTLEHRSATGELSRHTPHQESNPNEANLAEDTLAETEDGGDGVELMEPIQENMKLTVNFSHVSVWVPTLAASTPKLLPSLPKLSQKGLDHNTKHKADGNAPQNKQILYNVTGSCHPGEVLALMGPSGSGKTTLLSIIGRRQPKKMDMQGSVLYNGEPLTKRAKRKVGFVLQDDLLYESLTVWETLYFTALLRLPRHMTTEQKKERVTTVINALGLNKCKDTIIGGFFRRGISGGERKRVSVGHELLINPSILLLDEPTSGLDSTTAMHLVQSLRKLASGGRAVITTIHQPSSRLYQQLDKLMLLSEGHALYYGKAALAAEWFGDLGYPMPYGVNVADFILDCASGDVMAYHMSKKDSLTHMLQSSEEYLLTHPDGFMRKGGASMKKLALHDGKRASADGGRRSLTASSAALDHIPLREDGHAVHGDVEMGGVGGKVLESNTGALSDEGSRWGATYPQQLSVLFARSLKTRRFESLSRQDIVQFLVIGILAGLFWLQRANTDELSAQRDVLGVLFFELLFASINAMFGALFTFPNEFKMMLKERASGMYRLSAFYFARTASDLPLDCSLPTIFIIIVYFMAGLRYSAAAFFANWATVILMLLVAQSLGLLIGATVMNPKTAQTIAAVAVLSMVLIAGFFVADVPGWIAWAKYLSFIYYGYNLVQKIQYGGQTLYLADSVPVSGQALADAIGLQENPDNWPYEAVVLIGWLLFFRVCIYIVLRRRTASQK